MLTSQRPTTGTAITTTNGETNHDHDHDHDDHETEHIRDIHALTPPHPAPLPTQAGRWETGSNHNGSYSMSMSSEGASSENFTTMSREFSALVIAGSAIGTSNSNNNSSSDNNDVNNDGVHNLSRIGEDDVPEETNPLAIVPDVNPLGPDPGSRWVGSGQVGGGSHGGGEVSVQRVKKEEVETKISAWQNAKVAKINNRFKREDAVINGWEGEQVEKATSLMKKVEVRICDLVSW